MGIVPAVTADQEPASASRSGRRSCPLRIRCIRRDGVPGELGDVGRDLVDDLLFQLADLPARGEPHLTQLPVEAAKSAEGLDPAAVPGQRIRQQEPEPLPIRMLNHQGLQHRDRPGMSSEGEISLQPDLDGRAPQLEQAVGGGPEKRQVAEAAEGVPAPQPHPVDASVEGGLRIVGEDSLGPERETLESDSIHHLGIEIQRVAVVACHQPVGADHAAKPGDVRLEIGLGGVRQVVVPNILDEPIDGNGMTDVDGEGGEKRQRPVTADVDGRSVDRQLHRSEDPNVDHHDPARTSHATPRRR